MAPPLVSAASRAPRRARSRPFTASWWRWAPRRPRPVWMPQDTRSTTSSKVLAGQVGVRGGPAHQVVERLHLPLLGRRHLGHQLLGQHVEGGHRRVQHVEVAGPHPGQQGGALDQLVPGERVQPAGRRPLQLVVGPAHPLEEGADGPGRADLADQLDRPDVDAQLEGGRGHQRPQVAGPQPLLDHPPAGRRQAAVVGRHLQGGVDRIARHRRCRSVPAPVDRRRPSSAPAGRRGAGPAGGPPARPSCGC